MAGSTDNPRPDPIAALVERFRQREQTFARAIVHARECGDEAGVSLAAASANDWKLAADEVAALRADADAPEQEFYFPAPKRGDPLPATMGERRQRPAFHLEAESGADADARPPQNPEGVKRLAKGFAQEWLRPNDPDHADESIVRTLETAMLAFFACAFRVAVPRRAEPPPCIIGEYCRDHGFIHGAEAEELRERVKTILDQVDHEGDDAADELDRALRIMLDDVDARDSVAFLEALAKAGRAEQLKET